ncbi:cytochrome P450 2C20-like [Pongo abelii]|uniref:cytochrome P450 2C20-like n=1 Tax=Pongo abelii TaxID=9601 RepID=UPI00300622F4
MPPTNRCLARGSASPLPTITAGPREPFPGGDVGNDAPFLFFGVTETTSTILCYGLLILLKYPEVAGLQAGETQNGRLRFGHGWRVLEVRSSQPPLAGAKVQEELDPMVGWRPAPSLDNRVCLPYINAVLLEIQCFINVVPLGLPRTLTLNIHLHGHCLPKGAY